MYNITHNNKMLKLQGGRHKMFNKKSKKVVEVYPQWAMNIAAMFLGSFHASITMYALDRCDRKCLTMNLIVTVTSLV